MPRCVISDGYKPHPSAHDVKQSCRRKLVMQSVYYSFIAVVNAYSGSVIIFYQPRDMHIMRTPQHYGVGNRITRKQRINFVSHSFMFLSGYA